MRQLPLLAMALALGGCGATSADPPARPPKAPRAPDAGVSQAGPVSLVVQIQAIRNADGVIRVGLFEEQGFPDDDGERAGVIVPAKQGTVLARLEDLAPGMELLKEPSGHYLATPDANRAGERRWLGDNDVRWYRDIVAP